MNKKILQMALLLAIITNTLSPNLLFSYNYAVDEKFLRKDFWLDSLKNPKGIILTQEEISINNQETLEKIPFVVDLTTYLDNLEEQDVFDLLFIYKTPEVKMYLGSKELSPSYFQKLVKNADVKNISKANFSYGFVVKKDNLRSFPSSVSLYGKPDDIEFDSLQETAIYSNAPVLILHKSKDGKFLFVKAQNYAGWIEANSVVQTSKDNFLNYINAENFLVVTANKLMLSFNPYSPETSNMIFYMGQKLQLVLEKPDFVDNQSTVGNYVVSIPLRGENGEMETKLVLIPYSADVSLGYLDYTQENIISQAFKMQGERYDWGGHFSGRDCSAFVQDIFNTFGINIPRNTAQIANMSGKLDSLDDLLPEDKLQVLQRTEVGSLLLMRGHVFLYLGEVDGEHYTISDLASVGGDNEVTNEVGDTQLERIAVNQVSINTLSPVRVTGVSYLDSITRSIYIGK